MPKCRFTADCVTREAEPQKFAAGEVYDLPAASVARWVRRGVAVEVDDEPVKPEPKASKRSKRDAGAGDD